MDDTQSFFANEDYTVTASIGIAPFQYNYNLWEDIYALADNKMYQAKRMGKNRIIC